MGIRQIITTIVIIAYSSFLAIGQEEMGMGLPPDDGTYNTLPMLATRLTRDFMNLPRRYSLKKYCPEAKSQSHYGTCSAWASVYSARTISEAISYGWTSTSDITNEAFSPLFVYALLKEPDDLNCDNGVHIFDVMRILKGFGCVKFRQFDLLCADRIPIELDREAQQYKIDEYYTLFRMGIVSDNEKIIRTRKAISENHPVVIAMHIPQSFKKWDFSEWSGLDVNPNQHGYHALCVVGYDDDKNGGSFHIMNSWSRKWGDDGFVWVRYQDYAKYVDQAYEMYVKRKAPWPVPNPKPTPQPKPRPQRKNKLVGSLRLQLSTGEEMKATLVKNAVLPFYKINGIYYSGNRYRIYISNDSPAYVYVIASDLKNNVDILFPETGTSPALLYKSNNIALPSEDSHIYLGDVTGIDYLCVLYSINELSINAIKNNIKNATGTFYDKVQSVLSDYLVPKDDVSYSKNTISFNAQSDKSVLPIIAEITHK